MKTFETHDLSLASALAQCGMHLIEAANRGRVVFLFEDSQTLRKAVSRYLEGDLRVEPLSFLLTWKKLRSAISEALAKEHTR